MSGFRKRPFVAKQATVRFSGSKPAASARLCAPASPGTVSGKVSVFGTVQTACFYRCPSLQKPRGEPGQEKTPGEGEILRGLRASFASILCNARAKVSFFGSFPGHALLRPHGGDGGKFDIRPKGEQIRESCSVSAASWEIGVAGRQR